MFGWISGRKYKRCGIVAAQMANKILAPFQYSGTMDSSLFEFWFSNQLLPSLEKDTVIVMDNASFHCKKRLFSAAQNAGCKLLFLPLYSPELNPIEHFWVWLKRFLRKISHWFLLSMIPFLPLFNCGNYMSPHAGQASRCGRPVGVSWHIPGHFLSASWATLLSRFTQNFQQCGVFNVI